METILYCRIIRIICSSWIPNQQSASKSWLSNDIYLRSFLNISYFTPPFLNSLHTHETEPSSILPRLVFLQFSKLSPIWQRLVDRWVCVFTQLNRWGVELGLFCFSVMWDFSVFLFCWICNVTFPCGMLD